MTRINRPDTLLTELREIRRRLRLLEGVLARGAASGTATATDAGSGAGPAGTAAVAMASPGPPPPVPLVPARPVDWPVTTASAWEGMVRTVDRGRHPGARLVIEAVAGPGTTGEVRVLVADEVVTDGLGVSAELTRHLVDLPAGTTDGQVEILVQARRAVGDGGVRVAAVLLVPHDDPPR